MVDELMRGYDSDDSIFVAALSSLEGKSWDKEP